MDFKYVLKEEDMYWIGCSNTPPYTQFAYPVSEFDENCLYTIEEVEAYLAEHPDMLLDSTQIELDRLTREARARRDNLLREVVDAVNPMRWELLTDEQKDAWRAYRQALLDVPQQEGFPENIDWPEAPHE